MEGGCPKGRGVAEDEKSLANLRRCAPPPSRGRREKRDERHLPPFLWKGDARRAGGWPKAKKSLANLRRCVPPPSRGRREKRDERHLPPSDGRGMPEGQGVGRRRKRAKPTSGATRHLLPEEGGRSGMSSPSTPFPWKGDARRAGGWPKGKESEANLRRCAPPPSRGRREK